MFVGDREHACVASESCRIFPIVTSQCTLEHNSVEVQKDPDYEMWKKQILSGIGEDPDQKSG